MSRLVGVVLVLFSMGSAGGQEKLAPAKGVFLVAKGEIEGGPFYRSVVLLLAHSEKGSLGLIVNQATEIPVSRAVPELAHGAAYELYFGGPVGLDGLLFLFRGRDPREDAEHVVDGVYYSGDRALLEELTDSETKSEELRLFIGHSGWAPGQLDAEIARGSWDVVLADAATVFIKDPKLMWLELSRDSRLIARRRFLPRQASECLQHDPVL